MKKTGMMIVIGAVLAATTHAAVMSYQTVTPTTNIITKNIGVADGNNVQLAPTRTGGQSFLATNNYASVEEVWFQVRTAVSSVSATNTVQLMFWTNTTITNSWLGLPSPPNPAVPTNNMSAATYAINLGKVNYAAGDIAASDWMKFTLSAADKAAIGTLTAGTQYGFTLWASDLSVNLLRVSDQTATGYNSGAVLSNNGSIDPTVAGSRDTNFFIVGTIPEPATLGMVALFGAGLLFYRRRFMKF